jgi:hypothetical protein
MELTNKNTTNNTIKITMVNITTIIMEEQTHNKQTQMHHSINYTIKVEI